MTALRSHSSHPSLGLKIEQWENPAEKWTGNRLRGDEMECIYHAFIAWPPSLARSFIAPLRSDHIAPRRGRTFEASLCRRIVYPLRRQKKRVGERQEQWEINAWERITSFRNVQTSVHPLVCSHHVYFMSWRAKRRRNYRKKLAILLTMHKHSEEQEENSSESRCHGRNRAWKHTPWWQSHLLNLGMCSPSICISYVLHYFSKIWSRVVSTSWKKFWTRLATHLKIQ